MENAPDRDELDPAAYPPGTTFEGVNYAELVAMDEHDETDDAGEADDSDSATTPAPPDKPSAA